MACPRPEIVVRRTEDVAAVRRFSVSAGLEDSGRGDEGVLAAWAAYDGPSLVGSIVLERRGELRTVNWLAVAEEHRGRGLASRLYAELAREAQRLGVARLWVTARAPGFFLAQGFRPAAEGWEADLLLSGCRTCAQYPDTCAPVALVRDLDHGEDR